MIEATVALNLGRMLLTEEGYEVHRHACSAMPSLLAMLELRCVLTLLPTSRARCAHSPCYVVENQRMRLMHDGYLTDWPIG